MAEENKTAATDNKSPALDAAAIQKLVADTVAASVTAAMKPLIDNQKIIADTMANDAQSKTDAAKAAADKAKASDPAEAAKPLTAADVAKLVAETMTNTLKARDEAAQSTAARNAFVADKLKGVPAAYQAQLGHDPAQWAAEEQAIRTGLKADLTAMGATVKDLGGEAGGVTASGTALAPKEVLARLQASGLTEGEATFAASLKLPG